MLVDCFAFFNEYNLLEGRLEYLHNEVDYFIVVEANQTFSGESKPYNFLLNQERYKKYNSKIIYLPYNMNLIDYSSMPFENAAWQRDFDQKDYVGKILKLLPEDTYVLFGDLDEIPNKTLFNKAIEFLDARSFEKQHNMQSVAAFGQQMFYYNFNQKHEKLWAGTVITYNSSLFNSAPGKFREYRNSFPKIEPGGWHLSYWNTPENISLKIKGFAHQEFNKSEYTEVENIAKAIKNGTDLFHRDWVPYEKVDRSTIDPEILKIFGRYEIKIGDVV